MNHQTIRKRTEPAFIEPMQSKPVMALPTDENWTFEIKFDQFTIENEIAPERGKRFDDFWEPLVEHFLVAKKKIRTEPLAG